MNRLLLMLLALGLATFGMGCAMCSPAYDYCPPTFTGSGVCDPMARANSVLSSPLPLASHGAVISEGEVIYEMHAH